MINDLNILREKTFNQELKSLVDKVSFSKRSNKSKIRSQKDFVNYLEFIFEKIFLLEKNFSDYTLMFYSQINKCYQARRPIFLENEIDNFIISAEDFFLADLKKSFYGLILDHRVIKNSQYFRKKIPSDLTRDPHKVIYLLYLEELLNEFYKETYFKDLGPILILKFKINDYYKNEVEIFDFLRKSFIFGSNSLLEREV